MNAARIYKELSFVDDKYILESSPDENPKTKSRARIIKISALAAAVCAIAAAIIVPAALRGRKPVVTEDDTDTDTDIPAGDYSILKSSKVIQQSDFVKMCIYSTGNYDAPGTNSDVSYPEFSGSKYTGSDNPDIENEKMITLFGNTYTGKIDQKFTIPATEYHKASYYYFTEKKDAVFAFFSDGRLAEFGILKRVIDPALPELNSEEIIENVKTQLRPYMDMNDYSVKSEIFELKKGMDAYLLTFEKYVGKIRTKDSIVVACLPNGQIVNLMSSYAFGMIDSSLNIDDQVEKISKELCGEWEKKQSDGSVHKFKMSVQDVYLSVLSDGTPYLDYTMDLEETKEYTDEKGKKVPEDILHEAIELIVVPE